MEIILFFTGACVVFVYMNIFKKNNLRGRFHIKISFWLFLRKKIRGFSDTELAFLTVVISLRW